MPTADGRIIVCYLLGPTDETGADGKLLTVTLSRQERGLLKMSLLPQAADVSPSHGPPPLVIADMYGTNIAISDKLQVYSAYDPCIMCGSVV